MGKGRTVRGIPLNALVNTQNANLGFTLMGLFYLIFPFLLSSLDYSTVIFGIMFLTIAIIRAKTRISVIGGLAAAFIGIIYFMASVNAMNIDTLWMLALILAAIFFIFELGFLKFGPTTSKAKAFAIIPLALLSFSLILGFIGYNPYIVIDWNRIWSALNYLCVLLVSLLGMLQIAGWNVIGKKNTNKWLLIFALGAVATAFLGTYQGTLFQW